MSARVCADCPSRDIYRTWYGVPVCYRCWLTRVNAATDDEQRKYEPRAETSA